MSKSRGNVVAPDRYVAELGADAVRCYLMFLGPWDQGGEWSDTGINGMSRWMNRLWELARRDPRDLVPTPRRDATDAGAVRELRRAVHKTIRRVTEDLERFKFNTALAALMELSNTMGRAWEGADVGPDTWNEAVESLLLLLAPMAPHIAEELWERTGHAYSIHNQPLPRWDPALAADEVFTLVVQVNGRLRDRIEAPASISEAEAKRTALESSRAQPHIAGKDIARVVYVPGKLVNIVTR
jgi:leucyl-tRNA synthetase